MNNTSLPNELRNTLSGYRHRRRAVHALTGAFLTLAVLVGGLLLAVLADRLFRLPPLPRTIFLVTITVAFLFCLVRWIVWPVMRRVSDQRAAVRLGQRFPEMEEDLVTAVELSDAKRSVPGVSLSLIASALSSIAKRAAGLNVRAAVPLRPLLETAAVFIIVGGILATACGLWPEAISNALRRLMRPAGAVPFFSYVKLKVFPGDTVIAKGDSLFLKAQISGPRSVSKVRLEARNHQEALRRVLPCVENTAEHEIGPLFDDLNYRMLAGDAISEWSRVRVAPPPALAAKSALLRAPEYADSVETREDELQGTLEIIEGTAVALHAQPTDRGPEPEFKCTAHVEFGETTFDILPDSSGALRSEFFVPKQDGELLLTLSDGFGLTNRLPESLFLKVVPDRMPRVRIISPGRDVFILPGDRVAVEALAKDELGLRYLELAWRIIPKDQPGEQPNLWQKTPLKQGDRHCRELAGAAETNVEALGLKPGDQYEYKAAAADYAGDALFRRAYSAVYRIIVMSEMEHLKRMLENLRNVQLDLLRLAAQEKLLAARSGILAEKAKTNPVNQEATRAKQAEQQQQRKAEELANKIDRILPELVRNPSTPTKLLSEIEKLARALRAVAAQPMNSAAQSLARAAESSQEAQPQNLSKAQQFSQEAARQLEELARQIERMRRESLLDKLAADAEQLAARQRELEKLTPTIATKTLGRNPDKLEPPLRRALERLVLGQESIETGVEKLKEDIEAAAETFAFSRPSDAIIAEAAAEKMEEDELEDRTTELHEQISKNVLFAQMAEQTAVANALDEVAEILRSRPDTESLEQIAKALEEFIKRQEGINNNISEDIAREAAQRNPRQLGDDQSGLKRDVSEQASALSWLARELAMFRSETAEILNAAAAEMDAGADDLYATQLADGLEHGEKALALLKGAREEFKQESQQMQAKQQENQAPLEALLLLYRIIREQKKITTETIQADKMQTAQPEQFDRSVSSLADRQSSLRTSAKHLQRMLAMFRGVEELINMVRGKMLTSRMALSAGDAGTETRVVQRQAVALLEKLLGQCKPGQGSCQGMAAQRMMALMQMMGKMPGAQGFEGGQNADVMPQMTTRASADKWLKVRARFGEAIGAGFEAQYPPEYRELVNAYFDQLQRGED